MVKFGETHPHLDDRLVDDATPDSPGVAPSNDRVVQLFQSVQGRFCEREGEVGEQSPAECSW